MMTHYGDPCIHCDISHDNVPVGPCQGDPKKAIPIACRFLGTRWDGVRHFWIRLSDGIVRDVWNAPYMNVFNVENLPIDNTIRWK